MQRLINLHTPDGQRMALVAVGNVQQELVSQVAEVGFSKNKINIPKDNKSP